MREYEFSVAGISPYSQIFTSWKSLVFYISLPGYHLEVAQFSRILGWKFIVLLCITKLWDQSNWRHIANINQGQRHPHKGSQLEILLLSFSSFCVSLKRKTPFICLRFPSSSSSPRLFQNIGEFGAKKNLQTIEQLLQFSYLLLLKEIVLICSFSKQVATKGNSP